MERKRRKRKERRKNLIDGILLLLLLFIRIQKIRSIGIGKGSASRKLDHDTRVPPAEWHAPFYAATSRGTKGHESIEGGSHRFDRILNRITWTGEASSSASCSLSVVVYPSSLGFIDFFVSRETAIFFHPSSLDSKIVDGRIRYRGGTVAKETRIIHTADRYMGRESIRIPVASATRYHAFRYSSHESISIGIPDACERLHHRWLIIAKRVKEMRYPVPSKRPDLLISANCIHRISLYRCKNKTIPMSLQTIATRNVYGTAYRNNIICRAKILL